MHGDLMYIFVITLEDKRVHITASSRGFYVNQTTEEVFNPKPVSQAHLSHSLVDLLSQIRYDFTGFFKAALARAQAFLALLFCL